jgi:RNase P subunit RPR2
MNCKKCRCILSNRDVSVRFKPNSMLVITECPNCKHREGCWIHEYHLHEDTKGVSCEDSKDDTSGRVGRCRRF